MRVSWRPRAIPLIPRQGVGHIVAWMGMLFHTYALQSRFEHAIPVERPDRPPTSLSRKPCGHAVAWPLVSQNCSDIYPVAGICSNSHCFGQSELGRVVVKAFFVSKLIECPFGPIVEIVVARGWAWVNSKFGDNVCMGIMN